MDKAFSNNQCQTIFGHNKWKMATVPLVKRLFVYVLKWDNCRLIPTSRSDNRTTSVVVFHKNEYQ